MQDFIWSLKCDHLNKTAFVLEPCGKSWEEKKPFWQSRPLAQIIALQKCNVSAKILLHLVKYRCFFSRFAPFFSCFAIYLLHFVKFFCIIKIALKLLNKEVKNMADKDLSYDKIKHRWGDSGIFKPNVPFDVVVSFLTNVMDTKELVFLTGESPSSISRMKTGKSTLRIDSLQKIYRFY